MLVFNRPEMTRTLAQVIAAARPPAVYVFGDGPRPDRPDDAPLIAATRAVIDAIDWPCPVYTSYSEENLGTKYRPATGLDWVFEQVEEAIFLEDDCLPDHSFFRFCDELLERYRHDERVMMIGGDNFLPGPPLTADSYLFTTYIHIWGMATWRRAWRYYDVEIRAWQRLRGTTFLDDTLPTRGVVGVWRNAFDRIATDAVRTWDHQFQLSALMRGGVCAIPVTNLVSNVGFGPDATHATVMNPLLSDVERVPLAFPLRHPDEIVVNRRYDEFVEHSLYGVTE
jgi:hypothetical protein